LSPPTQSELRRQIEVGLPRRNEAKAGSAGLALGAEMVGRVVISCFGAPLPGRIAMLTGYPVVPVAPLLARTGYHRDAPPGLRTIQFVVQAILRCVPPRFRGNPRQRKSIRCKCIEIPEGCTVGSRSVEGAQRPEPPDSTKDNNPRPEGAPERRAMPSTHTSLHYHLVFSTKNREPWFKPAVRPKLHAYLGGIVRGINGVPHAVGGVGDHVHLSVGLTAAHTLSEIMRQLKADSSRWIKSELSLKDFAWQEGYGAFTFAAPDLKKVDGYILKQEEHHRARTFQEEYVAMLKRGMVEFDDRFLW